MVNTVVFDIGNVLIDFRWQGLFEDLGFTGEKYEAIANATVRSQWWNEFDRGCMELEEIVGKFTENAPKYEAEIRSIFDNMDNLLRGRGYADEWIRELKDRGCKVYILSNMSKPAHEVHGKGCMSFLDEVDGAILSYQEKMIKPDTAIYLRLCEKFGLLPQECLFIDDRADNVAGAEAAGMTPRFSMAMSASMPTTLPEHLYQSRGGRYGVLVARGPRQPEMGSRSLVTSRSVKVESSRRTHRTGREPRTTSTREPGGMGIGRKPSMTAIAGEDSGLDSTATVDRGETTSGFVNRACALLGTTRMASSSGHSTGPPAEKA